MPRYIDADALLDDVRKHAESYFADDFAHKWVDRQPTADVAPVVRCRICKYWNTNDAFADGLGWCRLALHDRNADFYCASGVRMDGGADNG